MAFGLAVAVLVVVALMLVWLPVLSDQALMTLVGRDVFDGRHLYTEIFDAKQPGMYLWYGSIDALFGPNQPVAQLFGVLAAAAAAVLTARLLVDRLSTDWVRRWAVPLVAAAFLLSLTEYDLGQTELLMCVPAAGALLLVAGTANTVPSMGRSTLAGVCIGGVAVFKALLVLVPGVAVAGFLLLTARGRRWHHLGAVAVGALLAPLAMVGWLVTSGDLDAAWYGWFVYPGQVLETGGVRSVDVLAPAVARFCLLFAPVGVLALWRLPTVLRRRDPLDVALLAWVLAGAAVYAIQVWWSYYLLILLPGLVGLAVRQLDELAGRPDRTRWVGVTAIAVLSVPLLVYGLLGAGRTLLDGAGLTAASRDRIAERVGNYTTIRRELAAAQLTADESLYVLGDPRYQLLAGRPIALTTNGWSAAVIPPARWRELAAELRAIRPGVVFVDNKSATALQQRGAEMSTALEQNYSITFSSQNGTWYRLR